MKRNIEAFSLGYFLFKIYVGICYLLFNRKRQAINQKNIPGDKPVIYAPNHQNALMDAMAVLFTSRSNPVYVARADAFSKPMIAKFLRYLKMLPIFRARDGASELAKNEEIFRETVGVLERKGRFCIMPEGNHGDKRRLRPLVKGIFRVAFRAQEKHKDEDFVQIVPVGLDYENYTNFRSKIFINYGKPISVGKFYNDYVEDSPRAINAIRQNLAEELSKYMIDIQSEEFYYSIQDLRTIYNRNMRKYLNIKGKDLESRFRADKEMIHILEQNEAADPDKLRPLDEKVKEFMEKVRNMNFRTWLFKRKNYSPFMLIPLSLLLILFFPVFLYGFINNIIIYFLPNLIIRNVKDPQFHTSIKFGLIVFINPFINIIQFILVWILTDPGWIKWAYLVSIPLTGIFAHEYFITWKKTRSMWKYWFFTVTRNSGLKRLKELHGEIIQIMDTFVKL